MQQVSFHDMIMMMWALKYSLGTDQLNMVINCCDMISDCIGMINGMMCDESCSLRYMTTESVEHIFEG